MGYELVAIFYFPKLTTQLSKGLVFWDALSIVLTRGRTMEEMAFVSPPCKPRSQGSGAL